MCIVTSHVGADTARHRQPPPCLCTGGTAPSTIATSLDTDQEHGCQPIQPRRTCQLLWTADRIHVSVFGPSRLLFLVSARTRDFDLVVWAVADTPSSSPPCHSTRCAFLLASIRLRRTVMVPMKGTMDRPHPRNGCEKSLISLPIFRFFRVKQAIHLPQFLANTGTFSRHPTS